MGAIIKYIRGQFKPSKAAQAAYAEYISAWMRKKERQTAFEILKPVLYEFAKKHRLPVVNITVILDAIIAENTVLTYVEGKYLWYRRNICFEIKAIKMTSRRVFLTYRSRGYDHTDIFNR